MKKYIIIISLMLGVTCWAQTDNKGNFQKEDFLSQFGIYFENAEMTETGTIRLQAKESFASLSAEKKNTVMELVLSKGYTLASVSYNYKRELWQKDVTSGTVTLIDNWDLNTLYTPKTTLKTLRKTDVHPWFLYFGLNSNFTSDGYNGGIYLSSRLGFFLLKNRWDLALSYSLGVTATGDENNSSTTATSDLGIMSKVYFPIKKYNISPYVGLGISYLWSLPDGTIYNETTEDYESLPATTTWNIPVYLGVSWFVGPGSLDFGLQISNNTIFMVGYTFSPSALMKK